MRIMVILGVVINTRIKNTSREKKYMRIKHKLLQNNSGYFRLCCKKYENISNNDLEKKEGRKLN